MLPLAATLGGCEFSEMVCSAGPGAVAIRLRAQDATSGTYLGNPTVTARLVAQPALAVMTSIAPGDSTIAFVQGNGGVYEVTVGKAGYSSMTQQVQVSGGGSCVPVATQDLTVALTRSP
jgi:hypothetical protein